MERIVIIGAGESGTGAALLAKAKGFEPFVSDAGYISEKYKQILNDNSISFEEGKHTEELILNASEIVKSPGIPNKAPIIQKIVAKNIPLISELEFASRFTKAKFITITGTNGKTTTTLLTYHLLKESGIKVGLAGNIGDSLAKQVIEDKFEYFVLEVSSFQLDNMYKFKSDIAILLNITPDHLDRYDYHFPNYIDSKFRVLQNMGSSEAFIYFDDDNIIKEEIKKREIVIKNFPVSLTTPQSNGAYVKDNKLIFSLAVEGKKFSISTDSLALKGLHNKINSMAAVLAATLAGAGIEDIIQALGTFKNAPHRLEHIAVVNNVEFINDSKATNVDSVYYALEAMTRKIIWIAGGTDKGNDYSAIKPLVDEKVKALVCLGVDNKKLKDAFSGSVKSIEETQNVKEAIEKAFQQASPGDVVLLSPACASFDLFKNYEDRGDQFRKEVLEFKSQMEQQKPD